MAADRGPNDSSTGFYGPNMQQVWLVTDAKSFAEEGKTSERDCSLDLRLTYTEWLAIYFDALELNKSVYDRWKGQRSNSPPGNVVEIVTEFEEEIPGYPMLSRMRGPYHDAIFEAYDIDKLRSECLRITESTSNNEALRGLDKLLRICDLARKLDLSIYLVSN